MHENMPVYSRAGRCCLSHSCTVKLNLPRTPKRWTEKADGPSPFTFFVCLLMFLFSLLFLITTPESISAGLRFWQTLFSIGPGRFLGHFSGDDECSLLSSTLFQSQTVYSFQIPKNYPFSRNNHLIKKNQTKQNKKNWTIRTRQVCHTDSINKIELRQCITRCCYWYNPSILLWNVTMNTMHGLAWVGCVSLQRKLVS